MFYNVLGYNYPDISRKLQVSLEIRNWGAERVGVNGEKTYFNWGNK